MLAFNVNSLYSLLLFFDNLFIFSFTPNLSFTPAVAPAAVAAAVHHCALNDETAAGAVHAYF